MFQYKHYIFQLILNSSCENCDMCKYCRNKEDRTHFALSFYGWKDKDYTKLQPYNHLSLSDDNVIPEQFWLYNLK
jgi:hypothetical protein